MELGDIDSKKLIQEVKKFRSLWDQKSIDYVNTSLKVQEWALVALEMDCTVEEAKSQWKALKTTFTRELRSTAKNGQASTWSHFVDMSFLLESFNKLLLPKPNNSQSLTELDSPYTSSIGCNVEFSEDSFVTFSKDNPESSQRKKIKINPNSNSSEIFSSTPYQPSPPIRFNTPCPKECNEDYFFLLSLLPSFERMSDQQKMFLKIKIMQDVYNASYGQSAPNLNSNSSSGIDTFCSDFES